jgi:hypothetical protein
LEIDESESNSILALEIVPLTDWIVFLEYEVICVEQLRGSSIGGEMFQTSPWRLVSPILIFYLDFFLGISPFTATSAIPVVLYLNHQFARVNYIKLPHFGHT